MEELWDISRVAAYLGVTERTVYNKVRAGELPAIKVGRLWRVRPTDLEAWLAESATGRSRVAAGLPSAGIAEGVAERGPAPPRAVLEDALRGLGDPLERRLAFVAVLSSAVEALGWPPPFVVGGNAVEFYTAGGYTTVDIDLAGASEPVAQVLESWGFAREGRHWHEPKLGLVVEVPGSTLSDEQRARAVVLRIGSSTASIIGIEDLIVDRLAACKHWKHAESCIWAARLLVAAVDLDLGYLRQEAEAADVTDVLDNALREAGLR